MLETKNQGGNKNDDLDLLHLLEKLFSFIKAYGRIIALCSLIGMAVGFALYKTLPKQYSSTMLLHSYTLSNTEQIRIIENWNELLKNGEYEVLARHFNCNPETLKKVNKISASEIQKLYIPNNPNGFMVQVWVKDNRAIDSLSDGIIYGLENSDYIKSKLATRRASLSQLIDKVKTEISTLDSTKKNIESGINSNSRYNSSFIVDISSINSQVIGLNEKLFSYQDELKFTNAVQVLHRFEKFDKPASPKFLKLLVLGFLAGFAIGYLLSLYNYMRKRMSRPR